MKSFCRSDSDVSRDEVLLYAGGMVALSGIGVLTINQLFMTGYYNGMKARVAVCSIIYRKVNRSRPVKFTAHIWQSKFSTNEPKSYLYWHSGS